MLFQNVVFGPIHSRRLGTSLGINLLPSDYKVCNFDCCYCECGFNTKDLSEKHTLPSIHDIVLSLEDFVKKTDKSEMKKINSITFSGNGEPTLHPDFANICKFIASFRTEYIPQAQLSLLTNATHIGKLEVRNAIRYIDNLLLKLDCGTAEQYKRINRAATLSFDKLVENLIRFGQGSTIQTLLTRSSNEEDGIDNTTDEEFAAYMKIIKAIKPKRIMLYGIDRATPNTSLIKLSTEELENYADRLKFLGFETEVY
ncbi:MAG: radical SAM protein [Bacteroidales bacterium]|jgi:wyosine [tRNA(Phe)-imidazoG37] synthetase (radical SAM superfamily)|nr:radical SAM protein [Bacteroidales bacterium]